MLGFHTMSNILKAQRGKLALCVRLVRVGEQETTIHLQQRLSSLSAVKLQWCAHPRKVSQMDPAASFHRPVEILREEVDNKNDVEWSQSLLSAMSILPLSSFVHKFRRGPVQGIHHRCRCKFSAHQALDSLFTRSTASYTAHRCPYCPSWLRRPSDQSLAP